MEGPIYEAKSTSTFYVVYDANDGNIVHTHEYMALAGAEHPSEAEIEAEALEMASRVLGRSGRKITERRIRQTLQAGRARGH